MRLTVRPEHTEAILKLMLARARRNQPEGPVLFFRVITPSVSKYKAPLVPGAPTMTHNHIGVGLHLVAFVHDDGVEVSASSQPVPGYAAHGFSAPGFVLSLDALPLQSF